MIGKQVTLFMETDTNFLRLVAKGFVQSIGMGIIRIERYDNKGTVEFPLQHVLIERLVDDPDVRPMFEV